MIKIPLRMRFAALSSHLNEWEGVNSKAHHFSSSKGISRWIQVPGLASGILRAVSGDLAPSSFLNREGWTNGGWALILAKWLDEQLSAADPKITLPTKLKESDRITTTVYRGVGLCIRKVVTRNSVVNILTAPGEQASSWVSSLMAKKGGGVIRLLPHKTRKFSCDSPLSLGEEEDCDTVWNLEHTPWPGDSDIWVEGDWSPSREEVSKALFSHRGGRSVLLFGPPGVGKTETAVRAALLAGGPSSRALVVHGSVFARGSKGMSGRDAVSLVKAFGASCLIVDDMPPSSTVAMLEEFEALHREKISVCITLMTDGSRPRLPGLRPGRVDEIIEFCPPTQRGRELLLKLLDSRDLSPDKEDIWEKISHDPRTQDMTPAYLKELSLRIQAGVDPERALVSLSIQRDIAS